MANLSIRRVGGGILVEYQGVKYALDKIPSRVGADYNLISHAHIDHLPHRPRGRVLASKETLLLAEARRYRYRNVVESVRDVEVFDAGHILGSRSFLIGGKILYTGDINTSKRIFLDGFRPPQAEILIIEATYGDPRYVFGGFDEQVARLIRFVSRNMVRGVNIVLRAHPLGKPQIITHLLRNVKNLYVSPRVARYNRIYSEVLGLDGLLYGGEPPSDEPYVVVAAGNEELSLPSNGCETVEARVSGFMIRSRRGIAMSDHPDFNSLIEVVEEVGPRKVYTIYGYASRLAEELRSLGYDAEPLTSRDID